jgi:hypothetical protein
MMGFSELYGEPETAGDECSVSRIRQDGIGDIILESYRDMYYITGFPIIQGAPAPW